MAPLFNFLSTELKWAANKLQTLALVLLGDQAPFMDPVHSSPSYWEYHTLLGGCLWLIGDICLGNSWKVMTLPRGMGDSQPMTHWVTPWDHTEDRLQLKCLSSVSALFYILASPSVSPLSSPLTNHFHKSPCLRLSFRKSTYDRASEDKSPTWQSLIPAQACARGLSLLFLTLSCIHLEICVFLSPMRSWLLSSKLFCHQMEWLHQKERHGPGHLVQRWQTQLP